MRIERDDLEKYMKILKKIKYFPIDEKAIIFFPITTTQVQEVDGIELSLNVEKESHHSVPIPGLTLMRYKTENKDETRVILAYADITFCSKFNVLQFIDFYQKLSKKEEEMLKELDCLLVRNDYVATTFEL